MEYNVMLFMTSKTLMALNLEKDGSCEKISIDGNDSMEYSGKDDIIEFVDYIKDYYNIDEFTDLEMCVTIINLKAQQKYSIYLLEKINTAMEINLFNGNTIVPIVAGFAGLLNEARTKVSCRTIDAAYTVSTIENGKISCTGIEDDEAIDLPVERYAVLNNIAQNNFDGDGAKYKALYNEAVASKEKELKKLSCKMVTLETEVEKYRKELDKYTNVKNRAIVKVTVDEPAARKIIDDVNNRYGYHFSLASILDDCEHKKISFIVSDGVVVENKSVLGNVVLSDVYRPFVELDRTPRFKKMEIVQQLNLSGVFTIIAEKSGRFLRLVEDESEVNLEQPIGLIGNLNDTKEDLLKWYNGK